MVKTWLIHEEGRFEYILDTWSSIRSNIEDSHLYINTSDKKSILFNREICCFLSPFLSSRIKGTFQGSCCLTNYDTYIILPDVSSKAVYDLQSLMIKGTVSGLSDHDAKELKSLHSFLGFKSVIVKEENNDEITVEHEYRIEDDRTDGDGGYDGDNEGEDVNKDDRSLKVEYRGVAVNDGTVKMTVVGVPIPTSSEEKADDVDMSDLVKDPSTNENNGKTTLDLIGRAEKTTSASNKLKDNASVMDEDLNEQTRDNGEEGNQTRTSAEKRHVKTRTYAKKRHVNMNCNVKLEKLKKLVNEDHESSEIKSRLRQRKYSTKKEKSDSDDSDFHVENTSPAKKRKRFGRSNPPVNYNEMASSDDV